MFNVCGTKTHQTLNENVVAYKDFCSSLELLIENKAVQWNVTPLIGDFGGREGIFSFFIEPSFPVGAPLSLLHCTLSVFFSHSWVHAPWIASP